MKWSLCFKNAGYVIGFRPAPQFTWTLRVPMSSIPDPITSAPPAIALNSLSFAYGSETLLQISDWQVPQGARIFMRGASGSGKSTLLNLLCGLLRPSSGSLNVLGQDLTCMSGHARDRFRARHMGVVFQQFNLIPWLNVRDNVRLAAYFAGGQKKLEEYLKDLAAQLNLAPAVLEQKAGTLSIGQQQRVAVLRALINEPEILLVDEPTSALDQDNRDAFIQLLLNTVNACGATLLFVSHDYSLAAHFPTQVQLAELNQVGRTG